MMNHRCTIIFAVVGSLLLVQPTRAELKPRAFSNGVGAWALRPNVRGQENNLPVSLTSANTTLLGTASHLTATLTSAVTQPITYTLEFGDQSPAITGIWSTNTILTFSHIYTAAANYTVIMSTSGQDGYATIATIMRVVANDDLRATLTSLTSGPRITFTLLVTNTNATLPATHVVLSGSVPANARLLDAGAAESSTSGGDYGTGYVRSPAAVILAAGESLRLSWVVELLSPTDTSEVITQGHAASTSSSVGLNVMNQLSRLYIYMPLLRKDEVRTS